MQKTRIELENSVIAEGHKGSLDSDPHGLVVYSQDRYEYSGAVGLLFDETGSFEMAVDASFSGTPENVYIDDPTTGWTNSAISGTWDFASTAITPHGGTESIDATATVNGDEALIERSSSLSLSTYSAISGQIYISSFNVARHSIQIEVRLAGVTIGNSVDIEDYVDTGLLDAWQPFVIPKDDMGLDGSTIDQVIFRTVVTSGNSPDYYLDTINIEQTGSKVFTFAPPQGTIFEAFTVNVSLLDDIASVDPAAFMGVPALTNGVRIRTRIGGRTLFSAGLKNIFDFVATGGDSPNITTNGTNTMLSSITLSPGTLARFNGDDGDTFSYVIADDLSSLTSFRVLLRGRIIRNA